MSRLGSVASAMKFAAHNLSCRNMGGNALNMNILKEIPSTCGNTTLKSCAVNLIQMRHRHVMDDAMEPHRTFRHDKITGVKTSSEIVLKKFFRLRWGAWIRTVHNKDAKDMWKKTSDQRRHYKQHLFCTAKQSTLLDKMVTDEYKEPHYYVDDPYEPYHSKEEFAHTRTKPRPPSRNVHRYLDD